MTAWQYGDDGDRWPVEPGDRWRVGPHWLCCGDLTEGDGERFLGDFPPPDLAYVDPPWDAAQARAFRTKAGLVSGPVDFAAFLDMLCGTLSLVRGQSWIECGLRTEASFVAAISRAGGRLLATYPITYYRRHPGRLLAVAFPACDPEALPADSPAGLDDEKTPGLVIEQQCPPYGTVFDACTGRGLTAVAAAQAGRKFLGLELHPRRLAVAMQRLSLAIGVEPVREGSLS